MEKTAVRDNSGENPNTLVSVKKRMKKLSEEIESFANNVKMKLIQNNGQRLFGPSIEDENSMEPPPGTEVFVCKLQRDCSEIDIYPIFRNMGPIYQMRMMMNFSGTIRGYCYVRYFQKEDAERAVTELNGLIIREGAAIKVSKSIDKCRLYIPLGRYCEKSNEEVKEEIFRASNGVTDVVVVAFPYNGAQDILSRRFCFVSYKSHSDAAIARASFLSGKVQLWGLHYFVEWAQSDVNLKYLSLWNIPNLMDAKKVWSVCDAISQHQVCEIQRRKYGFLVQFRTHKAASTALEAFSRIDFDGQKIVGTLIKIVRKPRVVRSRSLRNNAELECNNSPRFQQNPYNFCDWQLPHMNYFQPNNHYGLPNLDYHLEHEWQDFQFVPCNEASWDSFVFPNNSQPFQELQFQIPYQQQLHYLPILPFSPVPYGFVR